MDRSFLEFRWTINFVLNNYSMFKFYFLFCRKNVNLWRQPRNWPVMEIVWILDHKTAGVKKSFDVELIFVSKTFADRRIFINFENLILITKCKRNSILKNWIKQRKLFQWKIEILHFIKLFWNFKMNQNLEMVRQINC